MNEPSPRAKQAAEEWWAATTGGIDTGWHKEAYAQGYDAATAKLREELEQLQSTRDELQGIITQLAHQQPSAPSLNFPTIRRELDDLIIQGKQPSATTPEHKCSTIDCPEHTSDEAVKNYYCNKCGYFGVFQKHDGCNYLAIPCGEEPSAGEWTASYVQEIVGSSLGGDLIARAPAQAIANEVNAALRAKNEELRGARKDERQHWAAFEHEAVKCAKLREELAQAVRDRSAALMRIKQLANQQPSSGPPDGVNQSRWVEPDEPGTEEKE